jgi:hypothetical protein
MGPKPPKSGIINPSLAEPSAISATPIFRGLKTPIAEPVQRGFTVAIATIAYVKVLRP